MLAKAVLVRPNVAALCMRGSRRTFSSLQGVAVTLTMGKHHLSSDRLLISLRKSPISSFHDNPILHHRRDFCIRASTDSIGSPLIESMEKKIKEQLTADSVVVKDAYGDGRHVSIDVISSAFEGKSAVNRQRMVYKAIWEELQDIVHAVDQMTTRTPSEAAGK